MIEPERREPPKTTSRFPIGKTGIAVAIFLGGLALVAMAMSHSVVVRVGLLLMCAAVYWASFFDFRWLTKGRRKIIKPLIAVLLVSGFHWLPDWVNPSIEKSIRLYERYGGEWQGRDEIRISLDQPSPLNLWTIPSLKATYSKERIYRLTPAINHQRDDASLIAQKLSLTLEKDGIEFDRILSKDWEINGYPAPGLITFVTSIPMSISPGAGAVSVTSPLAFKVDKARDYLVHYEIRGRLEDGKGIRLVRGQFFFKIE